MSYIHKRFNIGWIGKHAANDNKATDRFVDYKYKYNIVSKESYFNYIYIDAIVS